MAVAIRTLSGRVITVRVDDTACGTTTIRRLKQKIHDEEGVPPSLQRLRLATMSTTSSPSDSLLDDATVPHATLLQLTLRLDDDVSRPFAPPPPLRPESLRGCELAPPPPRCPEQQRGCELDAVLFVTCFVASERERLALEAELELTTIASSSAHQVVLRDDVAHKDQVS